MIVRGAVCVDGQVEVLQLLMTWVLQIDYGGEAVE
jgi:hypothetical protein